MRTFSTLLAAGLLAVGAAGAWADTAVTTRYVKNPSFENGFTGWTQTNLQTQTNSSFSLKAGNTYAEKWVAQGSRVGNAEVSQTLTGLPAGTYRLQVAAQNIAQNNAGAAQTGAYIFAGSERTTVTAAAQYEVRFTTLGDPVSIGFRATNASGNWLALDNFRLYFVEADAATLLTLLEARITEAQKTLDKTMQDAARRQLELAIAQAQATVAAEDPSAEDIQQAAKALTSADQEALQNVADLASLKAAASKARTYLARNMAQTYKDKLQEAYDAALAIVNLESDDAIAPAAAALEKAYDNAVASYTAFTALQRLIRTANALNTTDKEGADDLQQAIALAQQVLDNPEATPAAMDAATADLDKAVLVFRVANGTGVLPTVRTLGVVQGATVIFARGSFSSSRERGFCYSEQPEPTIFDSRSTTVYSNNGDIYALEGLKPATVYYVRAYAMSNGYKVAYGDVVKTATLPRGTVSYSYDNAGDAATNQRIVAACEQAVATWNAVTAIRDFGLSVHYVPGAGAGDGTADCSYGGYMRISQNAAYQATGTVMHEGAHGLGVGTHWHWYNNGIYRAETSRGRWLGARVDRVLQFLDNNPAAWLNGDGVHMWPYGINGAQEDNHTQILYYANALILEALNEDNLPSPNHSFANPAYTFTQDDQLKYYIKCEDAAHGAATAYLREGRNNTIRWEDMTASQALANDSCAWYVTYQPSTCYYTLTNAATGKVVVQTAAGNNGFRLAAPTAGNTSARRLQLMPSRTATTVGGYTFAGNAYWMVTPQASYALAAAASGNVAATGFNHANDATAQRWIFLDAEELTAFAQAQGETVGIGALAQAADQRATVHVAADFGQLHVTACGAAADVVVAGMDGRLVRRLHLQPEATATLQLPRGIYLVAGRKVMVR